MEAPKGEPRSYIAMLCDDISGAARYASGVMCAPRLFPILPDQRAVLLDALLFLLQTVA